MSTPQDRRQHPRSTVAREIQGEFHILMNAKSYPVHKVRDVSISGIGLSFPQPVERDTDIRLVFKADGLRLDLKGRIAWCAENKEPPIDIPALGAYQVGIELCRSNRDNNCLLFMALRKYLDDFE